MLLGKCGLWKWVVSKPVRRLSSPIPKKHKVEVAPQELRRSGRILQGKGPTSSSARPVTPEVIYHGEKEDEEAIAARNHIPYYLQVDDWIQWLAWPYCEVSNLDFRGKP